MFSVLSYLKNAPDLLVAGFSTDLRVLLPDLYRSYIGLCDKLHVTFKVKRDKLHVTFMVERDKLHVDKWTNSQGFGGNPLPY